MHNSTTNSINHGYQALLDRSIGIVKSVTMPLIVIDGLTQISSGEVLVFENDSIGQVLSFTDAVAHCMLLSTEPPLIGTTVRPTGKQLSIYTGSHMRGKVYDPLGICLSSRRADHEHGADAQQRAIDVQPPPLATRAHVGRQLETGTILVDSVVPIGHGQRELITGDPKTGKTSFLLSTARQQARNGTIIIYALIGKKSADLQKAIHFFRTHRMLDDVVIVASTPSDSPSVISLTPFTAMTIAEHFRDQGKDTLVILDDLSSHARFYREVALLEKRFPGRDSYPGDIFYTHARILERAGSFKIEDDNTKKDNNVKESKKSEADVKPIDPAQRTVAITCLPVAETTNGDLTDFIVSNLISITDGHLLFDARRFAANKLPAIDITLSVTRVGKQTQTPLGRSITQQLVSFLSRFYKASQLTQFGGELSNESREYLDKGDVVERLLSQTNKQFFPLEVQQLCLALAWQGWLRNVTIDNEEDYRDKLAVIFRHEPLKSTFLDVIARSKTFDELVDNILPHEQALLEFFEHEHQKLVQKETEQERLRQAEEAEEAAKQQAQQVAEGRRPPTGPVLLEVHPPSEGLGAATPLGPVPLETKAPLSPSSDAQPDVPALSAIPKLADTPKATDPAKTIEAPKPITVPKPSDQPNPTDPPKP